MHLKLYKVVILISILIPSCPSISSSETLSQLISEARVLVLDASSSSRQRFSDSTIAAYLNMGQREMIGQRACLRQDQVFQLALGTTYYALPANYLNMQRVTIGYKYLQEMTPAALDGRSRAWEQASGYPTYYFVNFSSPALIGFAPWPATSTDTDTVKMEYTVSPDDMVNSSDVPFNGITKLYNYHHGLAYFAAAMMSTIDGQTTKASSFLTIYTAVASIMKDQCNSRDNYLPSATGTP